jgi:hypothetical protein
MIDRDEPKLTLNREINTQNETKQKTPQIRGKTNQQLISTTK